MTRFFTEGFRVNKKVYRKRMANRKRRLARRLDKFNFPDDLGSPMMRSPNIQYEVAERTVGTSYGGIGLVHQLVRELDLAGEIDKRVGLFKIHLPYHESDHVLNLAYNALCTGTCLQDLELRRQDEAYLNALGAERIPDPTTAGDFCRRFGRDDLSNLQAAIDAARLKVWARQGEAFLAEACLEADGTFVVTGAECKQGIDRTYKGTWGYHPLVLTLAHTGEVLRIINRPGNRPSHEGAAEQFEASIALCRQAGFKKILLRGDTDFSQTKKLDGWHEQGVSFLFGFDSIGALQYEADQLPDLAWKPLVRPPGYEVKTQPRSKPERAKQQIVEARQYKDIRLESEEVAEFMYRPTACQRAYRMIVLRKNLHVNEPREQRFFEDYLYFFYITNELEPTPAECVFSGNQRCNMENILAQLGSLRALHAPVNDLLSNEAYMLCTSLAWNLKAWLALWLPDTPGRWAEQHQAQKQRLLKLEFRTFVNYWMRIPCQVLKTGRRIICRLLAWNEWQDVFFRLAEQLSRPLRR
jgi:hypothetical protein